MRRDLQKLRGFWAAATLAFAGFVAYESTRRGGDPTVPDVSTATAYAGHFLLYGAIAFCAQTALYRRSLFTVAAVTACCAVYGGLIEAYQSMLPGRESSALDGLANLVGAAAGAAGAAFVLPWWPRWLRF